MKKKTITNKEEKTMKRIDNKKEEGQLHKDSSK